MVTFEQARVITAITVMVSIALLVGVFGFGLSREIALIVPWPMMAIFMIAVVWLNSETRARWRQSRARRSLAR